MKLKKVLCMAALSVAVALTGIPQGAATLVYAEETQIAGLDAIIQQMYALYQSGNYAAMYALDADAATKAYVEQVRAGGFDRYVIDLDGSQKAMMYIAPDGYWWYFGTMENNLRQGQGTTVCLGSDYYEKFTGTYTADLPGGSGIYSIHWYNSDSSGYDIFGSFQGSALNGVYQVNAVWVDENDGASYTSSLPITYTNSILTTVGGWECDSWPDEGYTTYVFYNDSAEDVWFNIDSGFSLAAVGLTSNGYSGHWWGKSDVSERFSSIFYGNAAASVPATPENPTVSDTLVQTPAEPAPTPEAQTPAEPAPTPAPFASTGTYVVERGDNLSKIAQKVYGDRKYWRTIYEANKDIIKGDYIIWANQVLTIPTL